jgi:hypothetical protein
MPLQKIVLKFVKLSTQISNSAEGGILAHSPRPDLAANALQKLDGGMEISSLGGAYQTRVSA